MNSTKNFKVQNCANDRKLLFFFQRLYLDRCPLKTKVITYIRILWNMRSRKLGGKVLNMLRFFFHLIPFLSYFGEDTNDFLSWRHHFRKVFNVLSKPIFLLTGSANTSLSSFSSLPDHLLSPSTFPAMPFILVILVTIFNVLTTSTYRTPAFSEFALPWYLNALQNAVHSRYQNS